ncbi:MAG: type II toxin-antitoxin system HicB family antitoxin [Anaerolineales bacterium]
MAYLVCAEEMEGNWIAHVPDLPGCFASHQDREAALGAVPAAVESYAAWRRGHGLTIFGPAGSMVVGEVIRAWRYEADYEVNAFFASDRPPLSEMEIPEFERLLRATRHDLLAAVDGLGAEDLDRTVAGERWPIRGILEHTANAEWWYLDRIGLAGAWRDLPPDVFDRLGAVRGRLLSQLGPLCERSGVVTLSGETWSARKVLRRTLWHERDHIGHIGKLRGKFWRAA